MINVCGLYKFQFTNQQLSFLNAYIPSLEFTDGKVPMKCFPVDLLLVEDLTSLFNCINTFIKSEGGRVEYCPTTQTIELYKD